MTQAKIDLVSKCPDGTFVMYLVEQGPWRGTHPEQLRALQARLYDYVDVAIDGQLAKLYPESVGKSVFIQVDAYDTPAGKVPTFVEKFADHIASSSQHKDAVRNKNNILSLDFLCEEKLLK